MPGEASSAIEGRFSRASERCRLAAPASEPSAKKSQINNDCDEHKNELRGRQSSTAGLFEIRVNDECQRQEEKAQNRDDDSLDRVDDSGEEVGK